MALQDGAKLAIFIDGSYQQMASQIQMSTNSGQQRIDTLEGLAGFTPGSGDTTITATCGVPVGGQEYDFNSAAADGKYHIIQIPVGGKTYRGMGKFMDGSISQSVNANTETTFTWTGELKPLS